MSIVLFLPPSRCLYVSALRDTWESAAVRIAELFEVEWMAEEPNPNAPLHRSDWGLVHLIVTILLVWALTYLLWALWCGLPTPRGVFHLDLFPPAIRRT